MDQFVIYSRKSKFTGKGESIENQIELCKQFIANQYGAKAAENARIYEDEGFSGGNLERPQFKQMMIDSQQMKFTAIVVYRLDRISRNVGDFAKLIDELVHREIAFISIKEQFDTNSVMGRAMMYISSVFSQLERETIAERIRDNMHELSKTGRWLGGTTPTGYESESASKVTVDGKVRKSCKLKIIPDEIRIVETIFDQFLETGSLTKTETYLVQRGIRTKNDKLFSRFALKGILSNPVYMIADEDAYQYFIDNNADLFSEKSEFDGKHGIMGYNRTLQKQGKATRIKPIEEWIISVGKHKGVITGKRWIQVQQQLELNKSKSYRKPRSNVALLSGLLFCKECGDYMRPKLSARKNAKGELIYSYLCSMKERSRGHVCNIKNANGNTLDAKIIEQIKMLGENSSEYIKQLESSKKVVLGNSDGYNAELNKAKALIDDNEKEITRLVASLGKADGTASEEYIIRHIDELHEKSEVLHKRLEELEQITAQHKLADIEFDLMKELLHNFSVQIDDLSVELKRAAIRTVVRKVVWDGENAHVYLFGGSGDDEDLPELPTEDDSALGETEDESGPSGGHSK